MFTDFQINEATFKAFLEVIARHTVIILMNKRHQVGTGILLSLRSKNIILTANHNVEESCLSDLRFGFKPESNFQEIAIGETPRVISPGPLHPLKFDGEVVRDEKNDIAALVLDSQEHPRGIAKFYDGSLVKPLVIPDGKSILILGFPVGYAAVIGPQKKLVWPTPDHLRYDSTLNNEKFLPSSYDPENEFLLKYLWIEDGLPPHGFSGAGAWCTLERPNKETIWTPEPILVGIITGYLSEHQLLVVAGLQSVSKLLSQI